ncbi:hypothetical protein DICVIV_06961 [Dictyocaulus viviparus]|uniref:Uncharacterized protein n=1 Tax=Dictyocaulus viviparus TaxID=29172 RepID=A0A0D8XT95_DICVI|nr:hypothetical protein DICVIV_06961 [Dictyocaulus viviparus]
MLIQSGCTDHVCRADLDTTLSSHLLLKFTKSFDSITFSSDRFSPDHFCVSRKLLECISMQGFVKNAAGEFWKKSPAAISPQLLNFRSTEARHPMWFVLLTSC